MAVASHNRINRHNLGRAVSRFAFTTGESLLIVFGRSTSLICGWPGIPAFSLWQQDATPRLPPKLGEVHVGTHSIDRKWFV